MKLKEWGAFALLGLIWGSSFLWIKIAVQDTGPFTLVAFRLLFGLIGLLIVMAVQRQPISRNPRVLLAFLFMGVFNTAVPFTLISWGETRIDSGLAAILNSTTPLFTIIIAHFWLRDEKITLPRILGLIVGFVGVVILVSRDLNLDGTQINIAGQLAIILASISYAAAATFSRRHLRGQPPILQSTMVVLIADAVMWAALPVVHNVAPELDMPMKLPSLPITWFAIVWLGLLGSCAAYLLFFYLVNTWGPTRTTLVTYVFPVIGLILGVLFLNEVADWRLIIGSVLVVAGIGVVNFVQKSRPVTRPATSGD
jgi:drug/metabolite transporter (DMT)-like permease